MFRAAGVDKEAERELAPRREGDVELEVRHTVAAGKRDATVAKYADSAPRGIGTIVRGEDPVDACSRAGVRGGSLRRRKSRGDQSDYKGQCTSKHVGETIGSGDSGAN